MYTKIDSLSGKIRFHRFQRPRRLPQGLERDGWYAKLRYIDIILTGSTNIGKYVGNRPIRLSKIKDDKYGSIKTVEISGKKVSFCHSCKELIC